MGGIARDDYGCTDGEMLARQLRRRRLDIKAFEITTCMQTMKRSVEEASLGGTMGYSDYRRFLNSLLFYGESSSSSDENIDVCDEEDDMDPQYKMFFENLREDGKSYILQFATNNQMLSVKYEGEGGLDDEHGLHSVMNLRKVLNIEKAEAENDLRSHSSKYMETSTNPMNVESTEMDSAQNVRTTIGRDVKKMMEAHSKSEAAKCMGNAPSGDKIGTHSILGMQNNMMNCTKSMRKIRGKEAKNLVERDLKSEAAKDLKNLSRRKEMETLKNTGSGGREHKLHSTKDRRNNIRTEARNLKEEKDLKSKCANHVSAKADKHYSEKLSPKRNYKFGFEWWHVLNADDVDESYRTFLNSASIEGDFIDFAVEGHKRMKHEGPNSEFSSDSEVFVTHNASDFNEWGSNPFQTSKLFHSPENEQPCLGSGGIRCQSVFREKLMAKLGEPYNYREHRKLWKEINEHRPKVGHHELRGSGALKTYLKDELGPSYLEQYAVLKRKIAAAGPDRHKTLHLLRGFFFWLQNLAHEDAFRPWVDGPDLEAMLI